MQFPSRLTCALLPLFILVACDQAPEVVPVVPVPEVDPGGSQNWIRNPGEPEAVLTGQRRGAASGAERPTCQ